METSESTEVEVAAQVDSSPEQVLWRIANRIARTEFVPDAFRARPDAIFAAVLYGRELGWGPMRSLHGLNVIKGKVTMAPEAMRALVLAAGHSIHAAVLSDDRVTLIGERADTGLAQEVTWTMDDARRAKLVRDGGGWTAYPRAMLLARATAELCRILFADVISGAGYTADEMNAGGELDEPDELPATTVGEDPDQPVEDAVVVVPVSVLSGEGVVAGAGEAHDSPALVEEPSQSAGRPKR